MKRLRRFRTFNEEQEYLIMAYNFVPKNEKEINASPSDKKSELLYVYKQLIKLQQDLVSQKELTKVIEDPIAVDLTKPNNVKVIRSLQGYIDLKAIDTNITLGFGNGSRGNAGAGNRGLKFERDLSKDLGNYVTSRDPNYDYTYKTFMKDFIRDYLKDAKDIEIKDMGQLNQRRPLKFQGNNIFIKGPITDLGSTVTDVTVVADGKDLHLSLKMGGTVTFFNSGVATIFTKTDLEKGTVTNSNGLALLKLLGIDPVKFANTFTSYDPKLAQKRAPKETVNVTTKVNKEKLKAFLASGVGYGFFLVHAANATKDNVHTEYFGSKGDTLAAVTPSSVKVLYPARGTAKRIDVEIQTPKFTFKVNIRNKQGGLYPSHIMCDYTVKH